GRGLRHRPGLVGAGACHRGPYLCHGAPDPHRGRAALYRGTRPGQPRFRRGDAPCGPALRGEGLLYQLRRRPHLPQPCLPSGSVSPFSLSIKKSAAAAALFSLARLTYSAKLEEISSMSASTASFSSGPSAMRLMEVPFTIPRESTPSRLLAF